MVYAYHEGRLVSRAVASKDEEEEEEEKEVKTRGNGEDDGRHK